MNNEEKIKAKINSLNETFCGAISFSPGFYFVFSQRENLFAPFLLRGFCGEDFYKGDFDFIAFTNLNAAKNTAQHLLLGLFV